MIDVQLRATTPEDSDFLFLLYASSRDDAAVLATWPEQQREMFLRMQFDLQDSQYRQAFPGAVFLVIVENGVPIGRLYIDRQEQRIHVIDIAILPEHRGRGVGGAVLGDLLREADEGRVSTTLSVVVGSPAVRLYERLGFVKTDESGLHQTMVRAPR